MRGLVMMEYSHFSDGFFGHQLTHGIAFYGLQFLQLDDHRSPMDDMQHVAFDGLADVRS